MGISQCLQRLWHLARSYRWFKLLFAISFLLIIGGILICEKFSSREETLTCCYDNQVILSFPALASSPLYIPLHRCLSLEDLTFTEVAGMEWKIAAIRTESVGDLLAEFSLKRSKNHSAPFIAVVQDASNKEYLMVVGEDKQISLSSMKHFTDRVVKRNKRDWVEVIIPQGPEALSFSIEMF